MLYTGRTTRAALDALFDHGRPRRVQLLVLIDRGHRELPIEARFVGRKVQTTDDEIIEVKLQETDGAEKVLIVERVAEANEAEPRSLLGTEQLTVAEIDAILKLARRMDPKRPPQLLRGKRVVLLFYESSTRTRTSFEFAAEALGATTTLITATSSSIERRVADRHRMDRDRSGGRRDRHAPSQQRSTVPALAFCSGAGDQRRRRSASASLAERLLDALTITDHQEDVRGYACVIVGDIFHSRVARLMRT